MIGVRAFEPIRGKSCDDRDIGLDLDRIVWDPEYRREVIERLATDTTGSGAAETPE